MGEHVGILALEGKAYPFCREYATTGTTKNATREIQVTVYSGIWNALAMTSFAPSSSRMRYQLITPTPMPVRTGALRGRSLMLWKDLSPVAHCSKNGHSAAAVKKRPIISRPG